LGKQSCLGHNITIKFARILDHVFYSCSFSQEQREAAYEEMTKLIEKAKNNASAYEKRSEYCEREQTMTDLQTVTQLDPLRVYPYRYRAAGWIKLKLFFWFADNLQ